MGEERDPGSTPGPPAGSPWRRRARFAIAALAWLAIAGLALAFKQQWIDVGDGVPRPVVAAAPKPAPPPKPTPSPPRSPGSDCMTARQYEHLQRLPPYGVVKPGSALEASIKRSAAQASDGGP